MDLVSVFFGLVVLCWVLFFVLEGFDFGVGMLAPLLGRDDHERGAALRTVGPFWDGNEVWLVAAIGVTFAAFPAWYAALFAGLYLPMVALLLLLAGRGVALEFRGKGPDARWRRGCDIVVAACSAGIALLCGALLATFVHGLALGENHEVTGAGLGRSLAPLTTPAAALGALMALWAALVLGATFLALRTTGPVRGRARRLTTRLAAGAAVATCLAIASGSIGSSAIGSGAIGAGVTRGVLLSVGTLAVGIALAARRGREALAFGGAVLGVAAGVVAALTANGSVVLPSTVDRAWSLTMIQAAAPLQTLRLLSVVGVVVLPGVLVYQAYSYWVFRSRVTTARVTTAWVTTARVVGESATGDQVGS